MTEEIVSNINKEKIMRNENADRITWLVSKDHSYTMKDGSIGYYKTGIYGTSNCYVLKYGSGNDDYAYFSNIRSLAEGVIRTNGPGAT